MSHAFTAAARRSSAAERVVVKNKTKEKLKRTSAVACFNESEFLSRCSAPQDAWGGGDLATHTSVNEHSQTDQRCSCVTQNLL